jgi:phosphoenolpyruvate carboxykinase (GTP)
VIFTNVALTDDGDVWWEGMTDTPPAHLIDWQGKDWTPAIAKETGAQGRAPERALHGGRHQQPGARPEWDSPTGVPIDAFIFGGRRSTTVPLVTEARNWTEGVYMAATMGSETTAAAAGAAGRGAPRPVRDAALLRLQHGRLLPALAGPGRQAAGPGRPLPRIYCVNWFRKGADGKFVWPGYGENMRVLEWMLGRDRGQGPGCRQRVRRVAALRRPALGRPGLHARAVRR